MAKAAPANGVAKREPRARITNETFVKVTDILRTHKPTLTGKKLDDIVRAVKIHLPTKFHGEISSSSVRSACGVAGVSLSRHSHAEESNKSCENFTALCFMVFCEHTGLPIPPSVKAIAAGRAVENTEYQKEFSLLLKKVKERNGIKW